MNRVLVIAEAGVNHNGDLSVAKRLVDVASRAGADFVKFQSFKAEKIASADSPKATYQHRGTHPTESQLEMLKRLELGRREHLELIEHCRGQQIQFLSTAFDHESIDLLVELGLPSLKIPSGEITNVPYLRHIARCGLPAILSTGMATLAEIETAVSTLEAAGLDRNQLTILHCNTEYPTPLHDVNLRAMQTIRDAFKVSVGYSDHTLGIEIPIAAVALGATVIEKHFTLDRTLTGPDHAASLEPDELMSMISAIRNVQQAMGDGIKRPSHSETPNLPVARKSIVAATNIRRGEPFAETNLTVKRPGTGISPLRWDELMGRRSPRDFLADEMIQW